MIKKILICIFVCLIIITSVCGCNMPYVEDGRISGEDSEGESIYGDETELESTDKVVVDKIFEENNHALDAYKSALNNYIKIYDTKKQKECYLKDIEWYSINSAVERIYFAVVDLNNDDLVEVVLSCEMVLHYFNGAVYSYSDFHGGGTFSIRNDGTIFSVCTESQSYRSSRLLISEGNFKCVDLYRIANDKECKEMEYQISQECVSWYEFTPENIEKYINIFNLPQNKISRNDEAIAVFNAVLNNQIPVYYTPWYSKRFQNLKFLTSELTVSESVGVKFAMVDMDNDGMVELIVTNDTGDIMILRYFYGIVFFDSFNFNNTHIVTKDGLFSLEGDYEISNKHYYEKIKIQWFNPAGMWYVVCKVVNSETGYVEYYIDGKSVTEEEFNKYHDGLCKERIKWYDLTEENIEKYISVEAFLDESYFCSCHKND